jgi:undecaprenyl-diphosphatase
MSNSASLLEQLLSIDRSWFLKINTEWISAAGDFIFPILRYPKNWIPLYALLLCYALFKFKWKALPWILFAVICITLTDQISSHVLKGFFNRLRPCQQPGLREIARLLVDHCPGNASFTSSHAVNHFGIATFFFLTLRPYFKKWTWLFFLWAAAICYAQVYVGVHYPGDVICGAALGLLLGWIPAFLFKKYFNFQRGFSRPRNT